MFLGRQGRFSHFHFTSAQTVSHIFTVFTVLGSEILEGPRILREAKETNKQHSLNHIPIDPLPAPLPTMGKVLVPGISDGNN